ncbi:MAG: TPM domain-containing protein [Cytophagaceae bacterium]|nr:MAG: TPM domain-containing protein [Cytophagaceae bacterium]
MNRILLLFVLLAAWAGPARAADILPRPKPFTFVNDQANMLNANDAKKLENGLRKYADTYGTQVVLVTVPSLGGTSAADYARQLGTDWGVGQRDKNNGIVVLLSGKERQMSIEAGSGLRSVITPELTRRVITQQMTPAFKQGNYFAGLSKGLGTIMLAANPSSNPGKTQAATSTPATAGTAAAPSASNGLSDNANTTPAIDPVATPEPASSGIGMGTILIGVVVIGGGIWLISKLFRRNNNASQASQAPDFMGNRPNNPTPNFGAPNGGGYQQGGNYGGQAPSSGSGMGGLLATGAAAAAGAYLGNRLGGSHDSGNSTPNNFDNSTAAGLGGATPPANAGSDYFASRNGGAEETSPDYFSGNDSADSSDSFFSNDSAYDDTSSGDTGGGGFDSTDDSNNSGSW